MTSETRGMGVSAMAAYVPALRVQLRDWCEWTGNSWDKIEAVVVCWMASCMSRPRRSIRAHSAWVTAELRGSP
jgi:hypothetical protein